MAINERERIGRQVWQEEVMAQITKPEMFKKWIQHHARASQPTGMLAYCEGEGFGFNETGHYVPGNRIQNGYRGHLICRDCAERLYGDRERAARAELAKRGLDESTKRGLDEWERIIDRLGRQGDV